MGNENGSKEKVKEASQLNFLEKWFNFNIE